MQPPTRRLRAKTAPSGLMLADACSSDSGMIVEPHDTSDKREGSSASAAPSAHESEHTRLTTADKGLSIGPLSSPTKRDSDEVTAALDAPPSKRLRDTPVSPPQGESSSQNDPTSLVLATYVWICFVCLFRTGMLKSRVENDGKRLCAVCGECPQGIYQIHREELFAAQATGSIKQTRGIPQSNKPKEDSLTVTPIDSAAHVCQPCGQPAEEQRSGTPLQLRQVQQPCRCTAKQHLCDEDRVLGCASCHRTCHTNCDSDLCEYTPCGICSSLSLVTHENSNLCIQAQTDNIGCHACGRFNCCSTSPTCHAKCSRHKHLCGSDSATGCANCGHLCHDNNNDVRCPFYQRAAGQLYWRANEQQLLDTLPGTGGAVPHFSQVVWRFNGVTRSNRHIVEVDGVLYYMGHGDPGRAREGEHNNCLIDSLRQCIGITADRKLVRDDLENEFRNAAGRALVTQTSFLDVESHWRAILRSLFLHNTSGAPAQCDVDQFCVIALDATNPGNGNVNGNLSAPNRLVVMNTSDIHFDPCLQLHGVASSSRERS